MDLRWSHYRRTRRRWYGAAVACGLVERGGERGRCEGVEVWSWWGGAGKRWCISRHCQFLIGVCRKNILQ